MLLPIILSNLLLLSRCSSTNACSWPEPSVAANNKAYHIATGCFHLIRQGKKYNYQSIPETLNIKLNKCPSNANVQIVDQTFSIPNYGDDFCPRFSNEPQHNCPSGSCCSLTPDSLCRVPILPASSEAVTTVITGSHVYTVRREMLNSSVCEELDYSCNNLDGYRCFSRWVQIKYTCVTSAPAEELSTTQRQIGQTDGLLSSRKNSHQPATTMPYFKIPVKEASDSKDSSLVDLEKDFTIIVIVLVIVVLIAIVSIAINIIIPIIMCKHMRRNSEHIKQELNVAHNDLVKKTDANGALKTQDFSKGNDKPEKVDTYCTIEEGTIAKAASTPTKQRPLPKTPEIAKPAGSSQYADREGVEPERESPAEIITFQNDSNNLEEKGLDTVDAPYLDMIAANADGYSTKAELASSNEMSSCPVLSEKSPLIENNNVTNQATNCSRQDVRESSIYTKPENFERPVLDGNYDCLV